MGVLRKVMVGSCLIGAVFAQAQTNLQKFSVNRLSFQYRSSNDDSRSRCLVWKPLDSEYRGTVEYDQNDQPFVRMRIQAIVNKNCPLRFEPEGVLEEETVEGGEANERQFVAIVRPPLTLVRVTGPNFRDELVFEAPVKAFTTPSFLEFFSRSRVFFETRYATFTTDNSEMPLEKPLPIVPIFGGNIAIPTPWTKYVFVGFSMFQNLGNFTANSDVALQYSEFSFDLRGAYRGRESWGAPSLGLLGEFRGRNTYQLGNYRPFVIAASVVPHVGVEYSWFPGGAFLDWNHWLARIGLEGSARFGVQSVLNDGAYSSKVLEFLVNYRLTRKWAIGLGYSLSQQNATVGIDTDDDGIKDRALPVREGATNYFFRLTLLPEATKDLR